ncbi:MAG: hypothetical protein RL701_1913 [Pseudomonadota bacterium]
MATGGAACDICHPEGAEATPAQVRELLKRSAVQAKERVALEHAHALAERAERARREELELAELLEDSPIRVRGPHGRGRGFSEDED